MREMKCVTKGCEKNAIKKSLCNAHYLRNWRHGSPEKGGKSRGIAISFIRENIDFSENECLIWPFYRIPTGYGMINYNGSRILAHRLMCEFVHGPPVESSQEACHTCGKGHLGCVNPKHLVWKSRLDNIRDKQTHGTQLWGEKVHFAKLNIHQAKEIKYSNSKISILAYEFGVSKETIRNIKRGNTWKGIK